MNEGELTQAEAVPLYPLRPSELVQHPERVASEVEPLVLTEADWEEIGRLEEPLAERLEAVDNRHLKIHTHGYYPVYFDGAVGERRYQLLYESPLILDLVERESVSRGVDFSSETVKKALYEAALKDVSSWQGIDSGMVQELPTLTDTIRALTTQEVEVLRVEMPSFDQPQIDQQNRFLELDLNPIPPEYLSAIQAASSLVAKEQFLQAFTAAQGKVSAIPNPERVRRVVNTHDLLTKITTLRTLRSEIRQLEGDTTGDTALPEAQRIVLSLYRERINAQIARLYPEVKLLENDQTADPDISEILTRTALSSTAPASSLQRINRFLRGIGVDSKTISAIPERLAAYVENPELVVEKNEESERYNALTIDAQQMRELIGILVEHYVGQDERPWKVIVDPRVSSLNVESVKHVVQVPDGYNNGLIDAIAVAEHEGSHVLQAVNRERATSERLRLMRSPSSRNNVVAEAGAMQAEREAKQQMVGVDRQALPYYYAGLRVKEAGGTFRECYAEMFTAYAKRNDTEVKKLYQSTRYKKVSSDVYARAQRLFNEESSFDDLNSGLTSTEQLSYIEQEMVAPVMREHGLESLMYLSGTDLYSLPKLQRLGVIDVGKIRTPDFYLVNHFWESIKAQLTTETGFEEAWRVAAASCPKLAT